MAWEDRTTFDVIEKQFGINQDGVIKIMRKNLTLILILKKIVGFMLHQLPLNIMALDVRTTSINVMVVLS